MTGDNFLNKSDKSRYGYREMGEYQAPYKNEHLIAAVVLGAAGIAAVLIWLFVLNNIIRPGSKYYSGGGGLFFGLTGIAALVLLESMCLCCAALILKYVMSGFTCKYFADDEKFTAIVGSETHTIYYKDVQLVYFQHKTFFGKFYGYDITVKANNANEEFSMVFEKFITERSTPFYIIQERVNQLRALAEEIEYKRETNIRILPPVSRVAPVKPKNTVDEVLGRMSEIMSEDEMPAVTPESEPQPAALKMSEPVRVSPSIEQLTEEMPAVGRNANEEPVEKLNRIVVSQDGLERSESDILGSGTFFAFPGKRIVILALALIAALGLYIIGLLYIAVSLLSQGLQYLLEAVFFNSRFVFNLLLAALAVISIILIVKYLIKGSERKYKANGMEFVISKKHIFLRKHTVDEHIYYRDVISVDYTLVKFFKGDYGYRVDILTKFGMTRLTYVFPKFNVPRKTADLPFEFIRNNIKKQR